MTKDLRSYLTSNISMIFQDPIESLNPKMTIEEIVGEGLKVRGQKDRDEIHRQVVEMLEKLVLWKNTPPAIRTNFRVVSASA